MGEYLVVLKSQIENSELNDFIQENNKFDLNIMKAIKNIETGEKEIITTKISNVSFVKKLEVLSDENLYDIITVFSTPGYSGDLNEVLENNRKEELNNLLIDSINKNGQMIGEAFKNILVNYTINNTVDTK